MGSRTFGSAKPSNIQILMDRHKLYVIFDRCIVEVSRSSYKIYVVCMTMSVVFIDPVVGDLVNIVISSLVWSRSPYKVARQITTHTNLTLIATRNTEE